MENNDWKHNLVILHSKIQDVIYYKLHARCITQYKWKWISPCDCKVGERFYFSPGNCLKSADKYKKLLKKNKEAYNLHVKMFQVGVTEDGRIYTQKDLQCFGENCEKIGFENNSLCPYKLEELTLNTC